VPQLLQQTEQQPFFLLDSLSTTQRRDRGEPAQSKSLCVVPFALVPHPGPPRPSLHADLCTQQQQQQQQQAQGHCSGRRLPPFRRLFASSTGADGSGSEGPGDYDDSSEEGGALKGRVGERVEGGHSNGVGNAEDELEFLSQLHSTDVRDALDFGEDEGLSTTSTTQGQLRGDEDQSVEEDDEDELDTTFEDFVYLAHNMGWSRLAKRVDPHEVLPNFFDSAAEPGGDDGAGAAAKLHGEVEVEGGSEAASEPEDHGDAMSVDIDDVWAKLQKEYRERRGQEMPSLEEVLEFGEKMREEAKRAEQRMYAKAPVVYTQKFVRPGMSFAVGRRKNATAVVWLWRGSGKLRVNGKNFVDYFRDIKIREQLILPFVATGTLCQFDFSAKVTGGGISGQAGAVRHAVSRALLNHEPSLRQPLKRAGFLTRDPRMVESKKPGQKKARKKYQWVKR